MADTNVEYRVEQLESRMLDVGTDVKMILQNHLPHIQKSFPELELRISNKIDKSTSKTMWAVGIGFTVISILILVFKFVVI